MFHFFFMTFISICYMMMLFVFFHALILLKYFKYNLYSCYYI